MLKAKKCLNDEKECHVIVAIAPTVHKVRQRNRRRSFNQEGSGYTSGKWEDKTFHITLNKSRPFDIKEFSVDF
jgi:hypothetical protein